MPVPAALGFILAGFLGLCLGSFATALTYRIPRGISWIFNAKSPARSACPTCGHTLSIRDLVPVFSWLLSRGKCCYCSERIAPFYPLVELSTALAVLLLYAAWGFTVQGFILYLSVPFLMAALIIDWRHMILPDDINAALGILAGCFLGAGIFQGDHEAVTYLAEHVMSGIALAGGLWLAGAIIGRIKGRGALGGGDIKFLLPAGLFLGIEAIPTYLMLSGALGLLTALLRRESTRGGAFPFGPALIISLYFHLFLTGLGFDYKGVIY